MSGGRSSLSRQKEAEGHTHVYGSVQSLPMLVLGAMTNVK